MGRPIQNPTIRFNDVIEAMDYALEHFGVIIECGTENAATFKLHRCNTYRKVIRDNNDGLSMLDNYVFKRRGTRVIVEPRQSIVAEQIYGLDGKSQANEFAEWQAAEYKRRFGQYDRAPTAPTAPIDDDPNPFTQDKPLKLDDE